MKPATFAYLTPSTIDEAIAQLSERGTDAKVLAGGQSLIPLMNFRLARPAALVDIGRITGLEYIEADNGQLRIGALTRQADIEASAVVTDHCPLLLEATKLIGHPPIRHRGTIGGSIAHADPAAEYPTALIALDAEVIAQGPNGSRVITAADLFLSFFTTSLSPDEIITEVRVPVATDGSGWAFQELTRRHGDYAIVGAACGITIGDDGICTDACIALAGVAPVPIRCAEAEAALKGCQLSEDVFREAAGMAETVAEPGEDVHGTAEYKRAMVRVLTRRALKQAFDGKVRGGRAARD